MPLGEDGKNLPEPCRLRQYEQELIGRTPMEMREEDLARDLYWPLCHWHALSRSGGTHDPSRRCSDTLNEAAPRNRAASLKHQFAVDQHSIKPELDQHPDLALATNVRVSEFELQALIALGDNRLAFILPRED